MHAVMDKHAHRRGKRKKTQAQTDSGGDNGTDGRRPLTQRIQRRQPHGFTTGAGIILLMILALATTVQAACVNAGLNCVQVSAPTMMRYSDTNTDVRIDVGSSVSASISPPLTINIAISLAGATVASTATSYSFQPVVGLNPLKPLRATSTLLMQRLDLTFSLSGNTLYELSDTVLTVWVLPLSYPVSTLLGGSHAIGNFLPANASLTPVNAAPVADAQGILRPTVGFRGAEALVQDDQGVYLYIADTGNNCVRRLHRSTLVIDVVAGSPGLPGDALGVGTAARFVSPSALSLSPFGDYLYIADRGRCAIKRMHIATQLVTVVVSSAACIPGLTGFYSGDPLSDGLLGLVLNAAGTELWVIDNGASGIGLLSIDLTAGGGLGPFTAVPAPFLSGQTPYSVALDGQDASMFLLDKNAAAVDLVDMTTGVFSNPTDPSAPWAGGWGGGSYCFGIAPVFQTKDGSAGDACFTNPVALLRSADSKTLYVADGPAGLRAIDIDPNAANYGRVTTVVGRAGSAPLYVAQSGGSAGGVHASALFMNLAALALDITRPGWLLGIDRTSNTILSLDPSTGMASPLIHSGGQVAGGGHCAFALGDTDGVAADASLFSGTGMAAAPVSVTSGVFAGKMMVADNFALSMVDLTTLEKTRVWSSISYSGGSGVFRLSGWTRFGLANAVSMLDMTGANSLMSDLAFVGPAGVPVTFVGSHLFMATNNADATAWTHHAPSGVGSTVGGLAGAQTTDTLYIGNSPACQILSLSLASPSTTTALTGGNLGATRCGRAVGLSLVQDVAAADLALQNIVDLALDEPANLLYILSSPPQRSWVDGSWPAMPSWAGAAANGDALLLKLNVVTNRAAIVTGLLDATWQRDCTPLDGARGVARLCTPTAMALSLSKSFLFVADAIWTGFTYATVIRQVHLPSGTVVTVAGSVTRGGCVDAPQSTFPIVNAMTVANNGQLYVVGALDAKIRTVLLANTCFATAVSPTVGSITPTLVLSGTFAVPPTAVSLVCADPAYPTTPISCTGITGSITAITCSVFTPLQGIGSCPAQQFIIQITSAALQLTTPLIYSVMPASGTIVRVSPNSGSLKTGVTVVTLASDSFFANSAADIVDVRYQKNGVGTLRPCVGGFKTLSIPKPLTSYALGEITDVECGVDSSSAPESLDFLQFTITVGSVAQPFSIVGAVNPATVFTVIRSFVLESFEVDGQTFAPAFQTGLLHIRAAAAFPFNLQPNLPSGAVVTLDCAGSDFLCGNTTAISSTQIACTLPADIPPSDCTIQVAIGGDSAQLTSPLLQIGNRLVLTNVKASVRHSDTVALLSVSLLHNLFGSVVLTLSTATAGITIDAGSVTTNFAVAPSPITTIPLTIITDATIQPSASVTLVIDGTTAAVVLRQFPASDLTHVFPFGVFKGSSLSPAGTYWELQPASSMVLTLSFLEIADADPFAFVEMHCGITPAVNGVPMVTTPSPFIDPLAPVVYTVMPPADVSGVSYSCEYVGEYSGPTYEFDLPPITIFKVLSNSTTLDYVGGSCGGENGFTNFTDSGAQQPSLFVGSLFIDSPCQLDVRAQWPTASINYTVLNSTISGDLTFGSTPYLYLPPGNSTVMLTITAEAGNTRTVTIILTRLYVAPVIPIVGSFSLSALPTSVLAGTVSTITLSVPVFNTITATVRLICADVAGPSSLAGVVSPSGVQSIVGPSPLVFTLTAPNPAPATATGDLFCRWELSALGLTLPPFFYHVQSLDSSLSSLSGSCLPAGSTPFAAGTLSYTSTVAWNLESCSLTAVATSIQAAVAFGAGVVNVTAAGSTRSGSLDLVVGVNTLALSVTSEHGDVRSITVQITRVPAMVGSFSLSAVPGPIVRAGATSTITLGVPLFNAITATVQLICSQVNGSTALAGVVFPSAVQSILSLSPLSFTVTAPNPPPATATSDLFCRWELFALGLTLPPFSFHVQSIDTTLSALSGSCLPVGSTSFAPGTLAYTSSLPFSTDSCSLTAVANTAKSNLTFSAGVVNVTAAGTSLSGGLDLVVGPNVLTVSVKAESGDVQTVTVTITRANDVYVAPGVPPVLTVTVAPSINPCDTALNPCSPFGSICRSTANISTIDPTADVQKLMSCTCNQGFSGETCDLGIVGCPQCVTSMKGNATMELLVVGAEWIRRIVVGGLEMDFNATERVYRTDPRFRSAMDANWPAAVKALPYFTLVTFVAPALSAFTTVTTQSRSSSFVTMSHRSAHHEALRFDASNVTLVNPRSHYEAASIDAVFAGKFIVERTEYKRLWYSSSDCLKPGEMRPDGFGGCQCPEGCFCPGGGRCWPQAGYWSATETQIPIACRLPDTCPGTGTNPSLQPTGNNVAQTQTSNCASGYSGVACASCADGYYALSERCYACGSDADQTKAFVTIVIGATCITIALALSVAFLHAAQLVLVVTAVVVLQSIVTVGQQGARDLPGATGSTLAAVFSYLSVINFDLQILRPGCSVPALTFIDLFWATIGLICFTGLMFFLACCLRFLFRLRNESDDARIVAEKQVALEKSLRAADEALEKEELVRQKSRELRRQKSIKSGRKLLDVDLLDEEALEEEETKEQIRRHLKRQSTLAAHNFHTPPREDFKRRVLHSFLLLCSIFYLKLNTLQFKMFVCVTAPTPESIFDDEPVMSEFLKEDFQTPCYASAHLGTTISICVLFVFYSFLFPFATYVILCRAFADEAEENGCTSWLVRHVSLFRPSQSKDEQAAEAHKAMREEEQHHKLVAKNAMADAKVDAAGAGVTLVSSKDAATAPPSRSTSFAVLPLSTAMTLAYIEHHRMQTFGFLFLHIKHSVFSYRLSQYVINFCFAAITTQVTRIDVQLFLLGFCFVVEALIVAWYLPFETMADNALHGGLDMLLLSHTAVMLSVQQGGEHMTLFFTLVALFGALLILIALRSRVAEFFRSKARMKRSLSKYRGEQSMRTGIIELGRVGTMNMPPRGSPSRSPERSRVAFAADPAGAADEGPAVRMHQDPSDNHDENAVARFEAPLSPSNNQTIDPPTPPAAAGAPRSEQGRVFVHRDPSLAGPSGHPRVVVRSQEPCSPLHADSISSPTPGHGGHDSNASDELLGQSNAQSDATTATAGAMVPAVATGETRKSQSSGSRGNSTPNSARTPNAQTACTTQPASPAGMVTPQRSPTGSPKAGPFSSAFSSANSSPSSTTPDGTPKQAPRGILVSGKVTRGQPRALAIETTVHNLAVGSAATTAWSAGSASASATSAGVVAGGVAAASVPSSPQRTVSYKRAMTAASAGGSPPAINRAASSKRGGILRSPPPTLAVGDSVDSSPATGSPVANSAATLAWRAKRLGREASTPASPLTTSAPRSRFGSDIPPDTPTAVDAGMTFGETPKVGPLDAGGLSGFLPGTPHASGSPGPAFGFSPLLRAGHANSEQTAAAAGEAPLDSLMLAGSTAGVPLSSSSNSPHVSFIGAGGGGAGHGSTLSPPREPRDPAEFGARSSGGHGSPGFTRAVSAAAKRSTLMSSVLQHNVQREEEDE